MAAESHRCNSLDKGKAYAKLRQFRNDDIGPVSSEATPYHSFEALQKTPGEDTEHTVENRASHKPKIIVSRSNSADSQDVPYNVVSISQYNLHMVAMQESLDAQRTLMTSEIVALETRNARLEQVLRSTVLSLNDTEAQNKCLLEKLALADSELKKMHDIEDSYYRTQEKLRECQMHIEVLERNLGGVRSRLASNGRVRNFDDNKHETTNHQMAQMYFNRKQKSAEIATEMPPIIQFIWKRPPTLTPCGSSSQNPKVWKTRSQTKGHTEKKHEALSVTKCEGGNVTPDGVWTANELHTNDSIDSLHWSSTGCDVGHLKRNLHIVPSCGKNSHVHDMDPARQGGLECHRHILIDDVVSNIDAYRIPGTCFNAKEYQGHHRARFARQREPHNKMTTREAKSEDLLSESTPSLASSLDDMISLHDEAEASDLDCSGHVYRPGCKPMAWSTAETFVAEGCPNEQINESSLQPPIMKQAKVKRNSQQGPMDYESKQRSNGQARFVSPASSDSAFRDEESKLASLRQKARAILERRRNKQSSRTLLNDEHQNQSRPLRTPDYKKISEVSDEIVTTERNWKDQARRTTLITDTKSSDSGLTYVKEVAVDLDSDDEVPNNSDVQVKGGGWISSTSVTEKRSSQTSSLSRGVKTSVPQPSRHVSAIKMAKIIDQNSTEEQMAAGEANSTDSSDSLIVIQDGPALRSRSPSASRVSFSIPLTSSSAAHDLSISQRLAPSSSANAISSTSIRSSRGRTATRISKHTIPSRFPSHRHPSPDRSDNGQLLDKYHKGLNPITWEPLPYYSKSKLDEKKDECIQTDEMSKSGSVRSSIVSSIIQKM